MKRIIQYVRVGHALKTQVAKLDEREVQIITKRGSVIFDENGICYEQITRGPRIGVIVATGKEKIGFSLLSPRETKATNWPLAIELATKRAEGITKNPEHVADFLKPQLEYMRQRSLRYFK